MSFLSKRLAGGLRLFKTSQLGVVSPLSVRASLALNTIVRQKSTYSDPDVHKPTLEIDGLARSSRLSRPISPHLTIYQPQLTWVLSGLHRATGGVLAVGFYLGAISYALVPFDSATIVSLVASVPYPVLFGLKLTAATTVVYHSLNGIRHGIWDFAKALTLKGVYNTGYIVIGLTGIISLALAFV